MVTQTMINKVLEKTLRLNDKFKDSLFEHEVELKMKNLKNISEVYDRLYTIKTGMSLNDYISKNRAYIYQNSTIIKTLKITPEEQKYMTTLIGMEEKKIRKDKRNQEWYKENKDTYNENRKEKYKETVKAAGKQTREEKNEMIRGQIKELLKQGLKQKEIAEKLNSDVITIRRHMKIIKENQ